MLCIGIVKPSQVRLNNDVTQPDQPPNGCLIAVAGYLWLIIGNCFGFNQCFYAQRSRRRCSMPVRTGQAIRHQQRTFAAGPAVLADVQPHRKAGLFIMLSLCLLICVPSPPPPFLAR